jgi:hypothetical protein
MKPLLLFLFILIVVSSCAQKKATNTREKDMINFNVQSSYSLYPDLSLQIYLKKDINDSLLKSIPGIIKEQLPNAYVSDITKYKQYYFIMIDFQGMPFEEGTHSLERSFLQLSKINYSLEIEKIIVE